MKPALIARLLVEEYDRQPYITFSMGRGPIEYPKANYRRFLRTIANGSNRNTNVQKGCAAAVRQIEGR